MEIYDKIYIFHLSPPRECYKSNIDNLFYEKCPIPRFSDDLTNLKSLHLQHPSKIFEDESGSYAMVNFDLNRILEFILLKNSPLEETYISLIIRGMVELILNIHSHDVSGISFGLSNFFIANNARLILRNKYTLTPNSNKTFQDWTNFCDFVWKVIPLDKTGEKQISISRNFKNFLKELELIKNTNFSTQEKFKKLTSIKFLCNKNNILNDLIEENASIVNSGLKYPILIEIKNLKELSIQEKSGNSFHLGFEQTKPGEILSIEKDNEKYLKTLLFVFDKYKNLEENKQKSNVVNLLNTIENSLRSMEENSPLSSLKLIKSYLQNTGF